MIHSIHRQARLSADTSKRLYIMNLDQRGTGNFSGLPVRPAISQCEYVPETDPIPVRIVGQFIDNSHGGSKFTGDWTFPVAVVCWPITVPLAILAVVWFFGLVPLWEKIRSQNQSTQAQTPEVPVNPHAQRAASYEEEGNTAMAEHTRRLYDL